MKYALIGRQKVEPFKGGQAKCPCCDTLVIAKCGDIKIHHWAHKTKVNCDHWWENETEWHRKWKDNFPKEWQEVIHYDNSGEKHIADVKTDKGWVVEFQYSPISETEKISRNNFYSKILWVVDGNRRKLELDKFIMVLKNARIIRLPTIEIYEVSSPDKSTLLKEWINNGVSVFIDFTKDDYQTLWWILPFTINGKGYIKPIPKVTFLSLLEQPDIDMLLTSNLSAIKRALEKSSGPTSNAPILRSLYRRRSRRF